MKNKLKILLLLALILVCFFIPEMFNLGWRLNGGTFLDARENHIEFVYKGKTIAVVNNNCIASLSTQNDVFEAKCQNGKNSKWVKGVLVDR